MSGHSKWKTIKIKKGAADARRGKVFTVHARMIALAAKAGGDPNMNPALRVALDRARADNVPNANIERAVKKGTGEDKEGASYEEITYEAFGPGGSAFLIDVITDNKNRALTNVRTLLGRNGGNIASAGSVSWKFAKKAFLLVDPKGKGADEAELTLIDCGAEDLKSAGDGKFEVYAASEKLSEVKKAMEGAGFSVEKDELVWQAKDELKVNDLEAARKIVNLADVLDEDEDVVRVSTNVDFEESLLAQLG